MQRMDERFDAKACVDATAHQCSIRYEQLYDPVSKKMWEMGIYQQICYNVTTEECNQVPRENCKDHVDRVDSVHYVDSCKSVSNKSAADVSREDCFTVPKKVPKYFPKGISDEKQLSGIIA